MIKQLKTKQEWLEAFPVMKQLRTHLNEESFLELMEEAVEKEDYQMAALYEDNQVRAVIGYQPAINLYNGRHVWVCDLVTDAENRSNGYGAALLAYVEAWGKENGYESISLSSGLQRVGAHRFYQEKMDYDKVSYVFLKRFS
ncbi:GNAT family N-acetyltransferase [Neobacillus niacini]|uniref:GNAT family N-acetyltransferase n=1 Tax=Neobacillus niacini TaxID=86668 RepID=UPI0021CB6140|nr:GNAT family N-acetyltransferase [Neobacillus niacini]MCM3764540.1 GNAT family N-acetyltransferase [Neobacillus niacini]